MESDEAITWGSPNAHLEVGRHMNVWINCEYTYDGFKRQRNGGWGSQIFTSWTPDRIS